MLTRESFKTLAFVTNLGWYSGVLPYSYKVIKGEQRVVFEPTNGRTNLVRVTFVLNSFYLGFILFRVFQKTVLGDAPASLEFLVRMAYLFCAYSLPVVLQINTFLHWDESAHFLEQYIGFFKNIQAHFLLPTQKGAKCAKFMRVMLFIGTLITVQNCIIIMKKPYQDHLLTSLLNNPKQAPLIIKLPFLALSFWIWANTFSNIWVFAFHQYSYITCGIFLAKELDIEVKNPRTNGRLRVASTSAVILRSMHTLHRFWQLNYQMWFCPSHKLGTMCVATSALYGVIKLSGPRSVIMGFAALLCFLYLCTLFYKFGQFNETIGKTLRNWKYSASSTKYMKKFVASVPVLGIRVGNFYKITRTTVITVVYTVINNTITLFFV